ncbi:hypothetical protein ACS0TY_016110 [Phlomoides rotata]
MAQYEEERLIRIEENKRKMKELGIRPLAYEANFSRDQSKSKKVNKMKSNKVLAKDVEYIPDEEVEVDLSTEEEDDTNMQNIKISRPRSKKVMAVRGEKLEKDLTQYSTISMSSMVKMRCGLKLAKIKNNKENGAERIAEALMENRSVTNVDLQGRNGIHAKGISVKSSER